MSAYLTREQAIAIAHHDISSYADRYFGEYDPDRRKRLVRGMIDDYTNAISGYECLLRTGAKLKNLNCTSPHIYCPDTVDRNVTPYVLVGYSYDCSDVLHYLNVLLEAM